MPRKRNIPPSRKAIRHAGGQARLPKMASNEWHAIDSSRVTHAMYDPEQEVMNVTFKDGTPWHYKGISRSQWYRFRDHHHPGEYINTLTGAAESHGYGHL